MTYRMANPRPAETLPDTDQISDRESLDDDALLAGLRDGSARHAEQFVRLHIGAMRAVARRILGGDAHADDCVQEAFLKAFRKIDGFEGRSTLKTWLHRITVNEALMKLRALKRLDDCTETLPGFLSYGRQGLFAHDNTHHALAMAYAAVSCLENGKFDLDKWHEHREVFATHVVED